MASHGSYTAAQIEGFDTAKYATLAGMTILIYDYCITFESEVNLIWNRRWDATRVLFTVSRYITFIGATMTTYAALANREGQDCHPFNTASNVFHILSIVSAEGLLLLRIFAYWPQRKVLLYSLIGFACFCLAGAVGFTSLANDTLKTPDTDPSGCVFNSARTSAIQFVFLGAFELTLLGFYVYKRYHFNNNSRGYLVEPLYYDGLFYMACIISADITTIFIDELAEITYTNFMDVPQLVLNSVLASRFLFSLHKSQQATSDNTGADILLSDISNPRLRSGHSY